MSELMHHEGDEVAELQAETADLLLGHVYAPLLDDQHVRGVMPGPSGTPDIRVALGPRGESTPSELTAYEIPLYTGEELRTSHDIVALLRSAHTGTHSYPEDAVSSVMGIDLYRLTPSSLKEAPFTTDDWTSTLLRVLARPVQEHHRTSLRGFLFLENGLLRLYASTGHTPDVIGIEVRPGGSLPALHAMIPLMLEPEEAWRALDDVQDPHCRYVVDLTEALPKPWEGGVRLTEEEYSAAVRMRAWVLHEQEIDDDLRWATQQRMTVREREQREAGYAPARGTTTPPTARCCVLHCAMTAGSPSTATYSPPKWRTGYGGRCPCSPNSSPATREARRWATGCRARPSTARPCRAPRAPAPSPPYRTQHRVRHSPTALTAHFGARQPPEGAGCSDAAVRTDTVGEVPHRPCRGRTGPRPERYRCRCRHQ
ncbi:hypothetical protein ACIO3O_39145 [Streptomyces sp. NPDC087440]|uniref:hypothetical protein n=1 Tax=Streptomyces sp. NPDC087440 TaxID=3365790 RepID=UPI0037FB57E2